MVKKSELRGKRKKKGSVEAMVNRGAWTNEEDQKLMEYVKAHGDKNWRSLPAKAGLNRCGKSCRLRWLNYLRPGIKRGNISDDEEDLIIRLHNLLGNRWSLIAGRLPGRTDNEIKNHWNTHLSRRSVTIHDLNLRLNQKNNMDAAACPRDQLLAPFLSSHGFTVLDPAPDHAHGEGDHSILDEVTVEALQYILSPNRTELDMEQQLLGLMPSLNGTSTGQLGRGNCGRDEDFMGHLETSEANLGGCYAQSAAWDVSASDYFISASEDLAFFLLD